MTHLLTGLLLSLFTIVCLTKLADASHNGTEPAEVFLTAGDGRWRFFPVGACMAVRAGRGECVREIQLGRLDGRKARKAADFERRAALARFLIVAPWGRKAPGAH